MLSTSQARTEWGPGCYPANRLVRLALNGAGKVAVRPEVVDAVRALNVCLVAWSYETRYADTGAYNCRTITGGTGVSLHGLGIALDLNWQTNPYGPRLITDMPQGMTNAIKAIRTRSGAVVWRWGGDYRTNKDAMHFEVVCTRAALASGIDTGTLPGNTTPTPPTGGLTVADIDTILARLDNLELRLTELQAHVVHPDRTKPAKDQGGIERTLSSLARIEGALKPKAGA